MSPLPFEFEPWSLRRVFADDALAARVDVLTARLDGCSGASAPPLGREPELRSELMLLHLGRREFVSAAGCVAVAAMRADARPAGTAVERAARGRAVHLARLDEAVLWQWQQRFVLSTLAHLELLAAVPGLDRDVQARTHFWSAVNDFDQGLWFDAEDHFEQALLIAGARSAGHDVAVAARLGRAAAHERSQRAAA